MRVLLVCCILSLAASGFAQDVLPPPALTGYVTRVSSASDFDVNGWRIDCGPGTNTTMLVQGDSGPRTYRAGCPQEPPRIGLPVAVWGTREKKRQTLRATQLDLGPVPLEDVSSYGIIEEIVAQTPQSLTVRTDGYTIRIPASAHLQFRKPLHSLAEITANVWLDYKGEQQADGTVLARQARFTPNWPNPKAEKTRARTDYDPTQVTKPGSTAATLVLGPDATKIPIWPDTNMQARVAAIGEKLVPAYERHLPVDDPTRIDFRFYVTAGDHWLRGVLSLPSGIILIPHQIVERMQNDSQVAAMVADGIAVEMEAQDARMLRGVRPTGKQFSKELAGSAATDTGAAMVPGLGLALLGGSGVEIAGASRTVERELRQSARVSLTLMHDAGYDVAQAPLAWWRLSEEEGKPLAETPLPDQAANLYRDLSATWDVRSFHTQP